ncbi:MAG: hypothetical protein K8L99_14945 [Anaerolineae bacterium]|nr:hypothetical protein [Anaerolineae bacterium]
MTKRNRKKQQGHYCKICGRYRANEKFSGKGHAQHICKDCNRELQAQKSEKKRAKQMAAEAGLPAPKHYPMTRYQAANYLGITPSAFDYRRKKLELEPCGTYEGKRGTGFLFDMATIIAVHELADGG